jgi:hypothetical protein
VVLEATGNAMTVARVLSPHMARVIMANRLQVKAIAHPPRHQVAAVATGRRAVPTAFPGG